MAKKNKVIRPKARVPRGFADRGAAEIRSTEAMMAKIREVFERYGFDPVETPMFEYSDALGKFLPDQDPFMEKWLKNRFHPKTLLKQLKRYGPEWMEKFPQIPNLIFQSLQQVGQFEEQAEKLRKSMETEQKKQRQSQRRHWIAVAALLSAGLLAWPQLVASASQSLGALPTTSLVLLAIGALALLFR